MVAKPRRRRQATTVIKEVAVAGIGHNQPPEPIEDEILPLTYSVPVAGALLGLSRNSAYEAAQRGDIPTFWIGGRLLVPRRKFHQQFGI